MRFIRRCLVAASYVLVSLARRRAVTIVRRRAVGRPSATAAIFCWPSPSSPRPQQSRAYPSTSPPPAENVVGKVRRCSSTPCHARIEATDQFEGTSSRVEVWMRIYSVMFASAAVPLSLPRLTTGQGAAASFATGVSLAPSGRYVARFIEMLVFAMLLALVALPAPARAQTFTMSSVTATPATVQPGQTVTFAATITANQNASNYPVEFSLVSPLLALKQAKGILPNV